MKMYFWVFEGNHHKHRDAIVMCQVMNPPILITHAAARATHHREGGSEVRNQGLRVHFYI